MMGNSKHSGGGDVIVISLDKYFVFLQANKGKKMISGGHCFNNKMDELLIAKQEITTTTITIDSSSYNYLDANTGYNSSERSPVEEYHRHPPPSPPQNDFFHHDGNNSNAFTYSANVLDIIL